MGRRRWIRRGALVLGAAVALVALAHPLAGASDVWGNVGPASGTLYGRFPLSHYMLDQHFDAVSASLTGGVDVSGVPPMIAYFLASVIWSLTSFLASALIALFSFAFGLDLVNGSRATGGEGALGPVAQAIHSLYASVFGAPWLVLAVAIAGIWAMWKALVQRRYAETAGALGLSLIYVVLALFFVAQPGKTIGAASEWTNRMSVAFLSVASHGSPSNGASAREGGAQQLFDLLIARPWAVLEFGGLEHCVVAGTGSDDEDPVSVAVRPLSPSPTRDAELARRLAAGTGISAGRKVCVNDANKHGPHFLRFAVGSDERGAEYDALNHGDSSRLPEADPERRGYRLGVPDKPATDAMEEGGQYQRLLLAIVVFVGELGAFCLLGALSVGVILAQILLLLLLAFSPVALVAAAIPGRGHAFFKGWLEKLAGFLLRKAAYSLVLAILLAVNGALAAATDSLGWLMSFGLQALFFWAVFLQRKALVEGLIGIATGPSAPGREGSLRLLALYYGARRVSRPLRNRGRSGSPAPASGGAPARLRGGGSGSRRGGGHDGVGLAGSRPRPSDAHEGRARDIGGERPVDRASSGEGRRSGARPEAGGPVSSEPETRAPRRPDADGERRRARATEAALTSTAREARTDRPVEGSPKRGKTQGERPGPGETSKARPSAKRQRPQTREPGVSDPAARPQDATGEEGSLEADLRAERERGRRPKRKSQGERRSDESGTPQSKRQRRKGGGK
ncbi:MAG: hypothetical protein ACM3N0_05715 [Chloroflexota bacterium]